MALTRRGALIGLSLLGVGLSCARSQVKPVEPASHEPLFLPPSIDGDKSNIVIFMPDTLQTREVWHGLNDELHEDFNLIPIEVPAHTSGRVLAQAMSKYLPVSVLLMNNPTLSAYRGFQATMPAGHDFPPAVIVMASFLEEQYTSVSNATGISYELPAVTVFSNLRSLLTEDIRKVGTIYRPEFKNFTRRQAELAATENITVIGVEVRPAPSAAELKWAIRELRSEADAIWIQNDNVLLSPELISRAWISELRRRPRVPTVVGAASLVSPDHSFGTFAVLPDHTALGVQAAGLVFELSDNEWQIVERGVRLPLSTNTVMDFKQAEELFELRPGALGRVDKVLR